MSRTEPAFRLMAPGAYRSAPSRLAALYLARRFKVAHNTGETAARSLEFARRKEAAGPDYGPPQWFRPGQRSQAATRDSHREWSTEGDGSGTVFREVRSAPASRYSREDCEYYRATEWESEGEGRHPMVARVRGGWVAGYRVPASDWSTWDLSDVYESDSDGDPPRDAIRAAHDMARSAAETESEYQEGYSAGQMARETLREAIGEASDYIRKARTMREAARVALRRALAQRVGEAAGMVPPGVVQEARDLYRQAVQRARVFMSCACEARRDAWRKVAEARPWKRRGVTYKEDAQSAGFWEAFDNA